MTSILEELQKYKDTVSEKITPLGYPPKKPTAILGSQCDPRVPCYDAYSVDKYIAYLEYQITQLKQQNSDAGWQNEYNRDMNPDQFRNNW